MSEIEAFEEECRVKSMTDLSECRNIIWFENENDGSFCEKRLSRLTRENLRELCAKSTKVDYCDREFYVTWRRDLWQLSLKLQEMLPEVLIERLELKSLHSKHCR